MKIAVGADHGGYTLKGEITILLKKLGHCVADMGCHTLEAVDYPDIANAVALEIIHNRAESGILICGTGIGMSIAANRIPKIRAALCHDDYTARLSREHNNANILCLGERVTGTGAALEIVTTWITTDFAGGRHQRRVALLS